MKNKILFEKFSRQLHDQLPFCMRYEWWDEVVKDQWEVAVAANGSQVLAIMPFYKVKKGPWTVISNPHFTPYSGPFYDYPDNQKTTTKVSYENKINQSLIDQLPSYASLNLNCHLEFSNSLSFLWNGFQDLNRYTYLLNLKQDKEFIWKNFRENMRRDIRKAEKNIVVEPNEQPDVIEFCLKESYRKQKKKYPPIFNQYYGRIFEFMKKYKCGKSWKAVDKDGKELHASICCLWDNKSAYYLIGGTTQEHSNSGAVSLLLWHAIQESQKMGQNYFNFEGSILPGVEKFFRGFGGELTPYSNLKSEPSPTYQFFKSIKSTF